MRAPPDPCTAAALVHDAPLVRHGTAGRGRWCTTATALVRDAPLATGRWYTTQRWPRGSRGIATAPLALVHDAALATGLAGIGSSSARPALLSQPRLLGASDYSCCRTTTSSIRMSTPAAGPSAYRK